MHAPVTLDTDEHELYRDWTRVTADVAAAIRAASATHLDDEVLTAPVVHFVSGFALTVSVA